MDREKIKNVRVVLDKILNQHRDELKNIGISVNLGNASFDNVSANIKISIVDIGEGGKVVDLRKTDWDRYAEMHGLKKEWLGQNLTMNGREYKIVGLDVKKRKNPVIVESNGKTFVVPVENVVLRMGK